MVHGIALNADKQAISETIVAYAPIRLRGLKQQSPARMLHGIALNAGDQAILKTIAAIAPIRLRGLNHLRNQQLLLATARILLPYKLDGQHG